METGPPIFVDGSAGSLRYRKYSDTILRFNRKMAIELSFEDGSSWGTRMSGMYVRVGDISSI